MSQKQKLGPVPSPGRGASAWTSTGGSAVPSPELPLVHAGAHSLEHALARHNGKTGAVHTPGQRRSYRIYPLEWNLQRGTGRELRISEA